MQDIEKQLRSDLRTVLDLDKNMRERIATRMRCSTRKIDRIAGRKKDRSKKITNGDAIRLREILSDYLPNEVRVNER